MINVKRFLCKVFVSLLMAVALTAGCAASAKPAQLSRFPEIKPQYRPVAEQMEDNPVACLQDKLEECKALQDYTLTFYRQERLGGALKPMEKIQAWFRSEPFSVKFVWNNPEANYEEAVFVNGENENKLLVKERKGFLFLPPTTRAIDPALPAKLGKAKNPITSFGLARMIERSLAPIRDPEIADQVTLDYKGIVKLDTEGVPAHHLQINRPTNDEWIHVRQDIFINAQTTLPAGTDLWKTEEKLDARYRYIDINTNIELTDENFVISEDDENAQASAE